MKKMPTLFIREFAPNGGILRVTEEVTPGCEWVLNGEGVPTEKVDGSCCAIINGRFYKRYDAKRGKTPPRGAEGFRDRGRTGAHDHRHGRHRGHCEQ